MALATLATVKLYLRKQTTAEDTLLAALLASAIGRVEGYIRRPILATSRTFIDEAKCYNGLSVASLIVPETPVASLTSVTDRDDEEIDTADLRFGSENGLIKYIDGGVFANGPYTIVASVGLSARAGYSTRIEPVINQAILDVVADLYQRRNPAASQEGAGGGVTVAYSQGDDEGVPKRTAALLQPYRMCGVA
jgi:uncharacterized phiE125 gp8 family phage protein